MALTRLQLWDFRCFPHAELAFRPEQTTLFWGGNATGKTSLLEAIFLLGRGRSFRSAHLGALSRVGGEGLRVVGRWQEADIPHTAGLEYQHGKLRVRLDGRPVGGLAELAEAFPVQIVDHQTHHLISGGPRYRRQFLDWGVFHVEPGFFPVWRRYQRGLQQRNALLRQRRPTKEVEAWNPELVEAGLQLDAQRRAYLKRFSETATHWAAEALDGAGATLTYRSGWPEDSDLGRALSVGLPRDKQLAATQYGPHRAELVFQVEGHTARERLSRGQEKVLAGTLLLAQAAVFRACRNRACTLLLDDLPSELDKAHLARFMRQAVATGAQVFVTAIDRAAFPEQQSLDMFHVEQGKITPMV